MNKLISLESTIAEYNPDEIGITESWATDKDIQGVLQLEGYTCYRQDRMSKYSTKGGLLMYMKDTFGHRLLRNITVNRSIEALWCEIIIDDEKNDKVIIGLCDDSPGNYEEKSNMLYGDIYKAVGIKDCIVMGDFNRRGINWETLETDGHEEKILDLSQNLFLTQHVLEKTRKESTLDLVFSSELGMVDDLEVREEFGEGNEHQSDHRVIIFNPCPADLKKISTCVLDFFLGPPTNWLIFTKSVIIQSLMDQFISNKVCYNGNNVYYHYNR